jgi:hypothetical protein
MADIENSQRVIDQLVAVVRERLVRTLRQSMTPGEAEAETNAVFEVASVQTSEAIAAYVTTAAQPGDSEDVQRAYRVLAAAIRTGTYRSRAGA